MNSAKARRAYHKGHVSEDLLQAATTILKKQRFEDLSVRRLTREVGVTPANFYNHFESLDHLLLDLAADGFEARQRSTKKWMKKYANRIDALVGVATDFVLFGLRERQLFRIMFGQVPAAVEHERFRLASDGAFRQLVELVYGDGNLYDPDNISESHKNCGLAYAFFSLNYGLARNISEQIIYFDENDIKGISDFVETIIRAYVDGSAAEEFARASS